MAMKILKAINPSSDGRTGQKHDVWVTEIRLRFVDPARQVKLQKLVNLLKDNVVAQASPPVNEAK